jgi:Vpu protein
MAKAKQDKKAKKGKGAQESEWPVISVSAHPRATNAIRQMKAWAGLGGFVLVGVLSYQAGVEPFESVVRALIAGIALYVVAWMAGVTLWRSLVVEEARQEGERRRKAIEERARLARERAEASGNGTNGDEEAA